MNYEEIKINAERDLYIAMNNYMKACKSEAHSNSVKRGIKAAKERKARELEREVSNND